MSNDQRYSLIAFAWFFGLPIIGMIMLSNDVPIDTPFFSFLWLTGFIACFYFWATNDAKRYNVSKNAVIGFSSLWVILPVVTVFIYLFYSRGMLKGLNASGKFFLLCTFFYVAINYFFDATRFVT